MSTFTADKKFGPKLDASKFDWSDNYGKHDKIMIFMYYDGPITGICLYEGQQYYYNLTDVTPEEHHEAEGMSEHTREYVLYQLPIEAELYFRTSHLAFLAAQKVHNLEHNGPDKPYVPMPTNKEERDKHEAAEQKIIDTCDVFGWLRC